MDKPYSLWNDVVGKVLALANREQKSLKLLESVGSCGTKDDLDDDVLENDRDWQMYSAAKSPIMERLVEEVLCLASDSRNVRWINRAVREARLRKFDKSLRAYEFIRNLRFLWIKEESDELF